MLSREQSISDHKAAAHRQYWRDRPDEGNNMLKEVEAGVSESTVSLSTGASLFLQRAGDGDELVIFLHAVGGDHSSWRLQMQELSSKYSCVSLDLRGHGRSKGLAKAGGSIADVTMRAFAEDVGALIEQLGFAKAHIVGLSMGAVVALELFSQRKELVQSLALANTWCFHPAAEARIAFMEEQLKKKTLPQSSAELIPGLFCASTARSIIDDAIKVEASKDPNVFLSSWRSMFQVDYHDMLKSVDVPVVLIGGTADVITPTDPLLTYMHSLMPMSWLVDIEGAGHFSNLDHCDAFNRILRIHLNRSRSNVSQKTSPPQVRQEAIPADTTAEALMYTLSRRGVEYFFSNSGTDFTPIIDALARYDDDPNFTIKLVACPHENTAIGMAHGYFLLSGKPPLTMGHVSVGTANMGLGIINAQRSRIPMLVMSGKTPWFEGGIAGCRTNFVQWGQDTFDQGAYFREFTKWDYELKSPHNLESVIDRALAISQSDPAGPVYLTLPKEPLCQKVENVHISVPARQQPNSPASADATAVERATQAILKATRPLIVTSELGRFRGGPESLLQFAEQLSIPVIEHGKRNFFNFPTEHPLHLGFAPSPFVEEADLIIAVECHVPWIPALSKINEAPILIQIGVDPLFHRLPMRGFPVDISVAADPAEALKAIRTNVVKKIARDSSVTAAINKRAAEARAQHDRVFKEQRAEAANDGRKARITKRFLSRCIGDVVDDETVIFNEYNLDPFQVPRQLTDSWFENSVASGLGWSLGAALGGKLASPDQTIVVTMGDGSYMFNTPLSAHFVAAAYNIAILIIVFNDSAWSTIKMSTKGSHKNGWAVKKDSFALCDFDLNVKFDKLAESCGGIGMMVEKPAELVDTLKHALNIVRNDKKHVLLNVICERDG
jgi:acetolactate synthase-1/2/3 large subunit